jgi:hypothetical protein
MSGTDRPEQKAESGAIGAKPACVALVPMAEPVRRSGPLVRLSRPDANFVTHLIATVQQAPQTRQHRRAAQADALSAYRAQQARAPETAVRARQVI